MEAKMGGWTWFCCQCASSLLLLMLLQLLLLLTLQLSCVPEGYHRSQIAVLKLVGSSNCNERQPTVATPDSESRNAVKSSDKKNSSKSSNSLHGEALPSMNDG
jgi:hypothetical protein